MLCEYGCGQEAKFFIKTPKKWCCSDKQVRCPERRRIGSEKAKQNYANGVTNQKGQGKRPLLDLSRLNPGLCEHGCGNIALYQSKYNGLWHCSKHSNSCPIIRKKNSENVLKAISEGRKTYDYYDSLDQEIKDRMNHNNGKLRADFSLNGKGSHKKILLRERGHKCESCLLTEWLGKPITLEMEHVDGNNRNNVKTNLLLLCPNCHSQTKTWRTKKTIDKILFISDENFIEALNTTINIRQALIKLGLSPKAANYDRAYNLIIKDKLERHLAV